MIDISKDIVYIFHTKMWYGKFN